MIVVMQSFAIAGSVYIGLALSCCCIAAEDAALREEAYYRNLGPRKIVIIQPHHSSTSPTYAVDESVEEIEGYPKAGQSSSSSDSNRK